MGTEEVQPGLRERKKARLRNQIAQTTHELILERGYDDTTVEEITRRVEISPPTFYNYFAGKDAVLGHIAVEQHARTDGHHNPRVSSAPRVGNLVSGPDNLPTHPVGIRSSLPGK